MTSSLGVLRMVTVILVATIGLVLIFFASLVPFKIRRVQLSLWVTVFLCRIFNLIFNVRINCTDPVKLRFHEGFIFMNHMSYLEALGVLSLAPVRFLAAAEVRMRPLSGWMAEQIGTIFVKREDKHSRAVARESIINVLEKEIFPPLVVFPEGRLGMGDRVNQFRYGTFEIAAQTSVPYLVCAVQFNRPDVAVWRGAQGEGLASAMWRLAKSRGKIYVDIFPLDIIYPKRDDDPRQLANNARRAVADRLGLSERIAI
ncbi:MAG: 1-acyl-sn-glycerol-3-phosphate acyltransferase [Caldilineaceae bacterium]|nr:1-acyl-sn-glycerol-3-phosphate acyltransferase [Caldilineaceae bacterium]